jgi:hypothetical protein
MAKYINNETISSIAQKCEKNLTSEIRSKFMSISAKYKLPFTQSNIDNANMVWIRAKELLLKSPKHVLNNGLTVEKAQNGIIMNGDCITGYNVTEFNDNLNIHISDFINEMYGKDYEFICEFDATHIMLVIESIYDEFGITKPSFNEIIRVTNYEKYFAEHLGISSVDKKELAVTNRIANYFDELFQGVKNKELALDAVANYLNDKDKNILHNTLFG